MCGCLSIILNSTFLYLHKSYFVLYLVPKTLENLDDNGTVPTVTNTNEHNVEDILSIFTEINILAVDISVLNYTADYSWFTSRRIVQYIIWFVFSEHCWICIHYL